MALCSLTQYPGCLDSVKQSSRTETTTNSTSVLFGRDLTQPKLSHFAYLLDIHLRCFSSSTLQSASLVSAKTLLSGLELRAEKIWLHLDNDVVDSAVYPLCSFPSDVFTWFDEVMIAVSHVLQNGKVAGMSLAEVHRNNEPSREMVHRPADRLVKGFEKRRQAVNG